MQERADSQHAAMLDGLTRNASSSWNVYRFCTNSKYTDMYRLLNRGDQYMNIQHCLTFLWMVVDSYRYGICVEAQ
eukprot:IDg16345t1